VITAKAPYIHPLADVQTSQIGHGTKIWQFVVILPAAKIGAECNICSHCFIENDVVIGDRVTIKNGVQLWNGVRVGDDVFIGPNVTFTNDQYPISGNRCFQILPTVVEQGVSIGAGAVLLPGLIIGRGAFIAAGAVVTKDVPCRKIVMGNPGRVTGEAKNVD
jgi:UDP-2-acetamido-3-amino-2,3-dideoxy-glucuronate N-acetyltransferase